MAPRDAFGPLGFSFPCYGLKGITKPTKKIGSIVFCLLLATIFLLGLFFYPEDGCSKLLQNVGELLPDNTEPYPKRQ
jgi:hypothetical protein